MSTIDGHEPVSRNEDEFQGPCKQIILFGDSITQMSFNQEDGFGFGASLQDAYIRRLDVINRGFGGYNTQHAIKVLPKFFPKVSQTKVALMLVFFGANDSCLPHAATHYVPVENYRQNLADIIRNPCIQAHDPKILLITPPPANEHQIEQYDFAKGHSSLRRRAENTKLYAEACKNVGAELQVPVVDLWTACLEDAGWRKGAALLGSMSTPRKHEFDALFLDGKICSLDGALAEADSSAGVHLRSSGYKILYLEVMKAIRSNWPELAPENLPFVFPTWEFAPK
ncbi:uncharacterized protein BP5553_02456 [Venustampulla echinocandica]|uniref:SGNH hydrolase-type esterase domain-containing protein n=1 Tax=Venustampulla echinocandica TaxID=2656787 RepID=A0A370U3X1_9HELO|nr:uncharacterized protein BP5553_02456 [Venustampulla echinocandica]RDL42477.1 hypothetical protein BP5553_02456 [Venustampulla echinocandica]